MSPDRRGVRGAETGLLRRTRRQLVLWSAGSTLLVLVVLGAALYLAIARQLATDSEAQLRQRATMLSTFGSPTSMPLPLPLPQEGEGSLTFTVAGDPGSPVFLFGGPASGTLAVAVGGASGGPLPAVPDQAGYDAARAGSPTMHETWLLGTPVRVYSTLMARAGPDQVIQVVGDRTAELRTLQTTMLVLLVGGALVVVVAGAFGWAYAGRALVPIRDSLRRQREFAADASHELRTPLAVIRGNVEMLRAGPGRAQRDTEAVDDIDAEVTRMTSLVDQLLLLARADSEALEVEKAPCDLAAEAADALEAFLPVAQARGVSLALDVEPAPMAGDAGRLRQLVGILVDNAVRHAPLGGQVAIRVGRSADHATLTVEDDGPGIRPADLPRVFDRFWRAADAPDGGSGLGLAIAAWVVERHQGVIRAENRPRGGARFVAELPTG